MRLKMAPGDSPPDLPRMSATLCGSLSAAVNACRPSTPACVRRRLTSSAVTAGAGCCCDGAVCGDGGGSAMWGLPCA